MMNRQDLQKLRELPVEGVAERLGLQVTRHKCLCPFHDDHHASLSFSVSRNTYRCFVCGASGGTIDLVMRYLNLGFKEACQWLADGVLTPPPCGHPLSEGETYRTLPAGQKNSSLCASPSERGAGGSYSALTSSNASHFRTPNSEFNPSRYARFFERPRLSESARRFLFDERKIDPRVARWCRLNSFRDREGIDWLQIPYYDREGQLTGIQNRNLNYQKTQDGETAGLPDAPRFRFLNGSDCGIYNLPVLNRLKPGEPLFITEGCSDCWAMLSAGHKAVAIPSATLLKPRDMELLSSLHDQLSTEFHMFPDRDVPGERLFLQLKEVLPNLIHHQLPLGCKDYSEYYIKSRRETRDCETRDCETRDIEPVTSPEVSCHVSHSTHHHHGN